MKTRQEIKELAKDAVSEQRGTAILIVLLVTLISGATAISSLPFIGWLIAIVLSCVITVLTVNVMGAFVAIYKREQIEVGLPFSKLGENFFRKLGGMFWMSLWTFIWSLLLIIPGIIKAIAYSMAPYILADCPEVTATDALKLSMKMTSGYKGELFVAYLSFIGWQLLSAFTFGVLEIVYVGPYRMATFAGYYLELRDHALSYGTVTAGELGMTSGGGADNTDTFSI